MNEFTITGPQSEQLMEAFRLYGDQYTDVTLTIQGNGNLVVAFGLMTLEIYDDGTVEEI